MTALERWRALPPHDRRTLVAQLQRAFEMRRSIPCRNQDCDYDTWLPELDVDAFAMRAALELLEDA